MLRRLFGGGKDDTRPSAIYAAIVAASRQKAFYSRLGVADSLEGRFELLVLHGGLVIRRFAAGSKMAKSMSQDVFDIMFTDLDHALREDGVGDMAVPKRIRRMAEAFYGRARAYGVALAEDAPQEALSVVVGRNIFGGSPEAVDKPEEGSATAENIAALARYIRAADAALAQSDEAVLLEGNLNFPIAEEFCAGPETMTETKGSEG